jgi:hypothetical protein
MLRLNKITQLFYAPDDSATIESGSMSVSDMTEFMGKDDEATLDVPDDDDDDEAEETGTGEEEVKDTKKETVVEEVTLTVPRKAVLAKYPNIFKEFPHLDKAVYREQKYSELLPTLADAKTAVDKAEALDSLSESLSQGNTVSLLKDIKENDPEVFNTVVDSYLDNLRDVDQGAYYHVLGNVIKHTITAMYNSGDDDNKIAAGLLNKFIFNSDKFQPPTKLSAGKTDADPRAEELAKKEKEFFEKQLDTHTTTVNTRIHNIVTSAIDKNIDPRGSMNEFTKQTAIEKCASELQSVIRKDTRFQGLLDKLWQKSAESNFSQESLDRIRSAYWSKAKGLLPDIIRKTRNTALKGLGTKSPSERSQPLPVGKPSNSTKNQNNSERRTSGSSDKDRARQIPKGTKSIDFLMRD